MAGERLFKSAESKPEFVFERNDTVQLERYDKFVLFVKGGGRTFEAQTGKIIDRRREKFEGKFYNEYRVLVKDGEGNSKKKWYYEHELKLA